MRSAVCARFGFLPVAMGTAMVSFSAHGNALQLSRRMLDPPGCRRDLPLP